MDMTLNNIFINISIVDEKWFISYRYIIELLTIFKYYTAFLVIIKYKQITLGKNIEPESIGRKV